MTTLKERWHALSKYFSWFNRAYLVDWLIVLILHFTSQAIKHAMPVFERDFDILDPLISHPMAKPETLSSEAATFFSLGTGVLLSIVGGTLSGSLMEVHHGILSLYIGDTLMTVVVEFLKNRIGRLRPDFLDRCKFDIVLQECTGSAGDVRDGRKSFPSGHSSVAFVGAGFAFLYLVGKTGCFARGTVRGGFLSSRAARAVLCLAPLLLSSWVAVTRLEDYRHHKEDVVVGALIGFAFSAMAYSMYWHNPFGAQHGIPKLVYSNEVEQTGYVLTQTEEPTPAAESV